MSGVKHRHEVGSGVYRLGATDGIIPSAAYYAPNSVIRSLLQRRLYCPRTGTDHKAEHNPIAI